MERDPLLLKASVAFAALMAGAAWLPGDFVTPAAAPAPVAVVSSGIDLALQDYEAARVSGNALESCARAHAVALAYLRAQDRAGYQTWEALGTQSCAAVGQQPQAETASLPPAQGMSSTATRLPIVAPRGGGT